MPYYRVYLFLPTANRADLRTVCTAITQTDHSGAITQDYNSSSGNKAQAALVLDEEGLFRARCMRLLYSGLRWVVRSLAGVVIESDISAISVSSTLKDSAVVTAMTGTYSESGPSSSAVDSVTLFGYDAELFTTATSGGIPCTLSNYFIDQNSPLGDILCLQVGPAGASVNGAEVAFPIRGYGEYEFYCANRLDQWAPETVFAGFTYAHPVPDPNEEIDVLEAGANIVAGSDDCQTVVWYLNSGVNTGSIDEFTVGNRYFTRWYLNWQPDAITIRVFDRAGVMIYERVETQRLLTPDVARWRFNGWVFQYGSGARPASVGRCVFYGLRLPPG